MAEGVPGRLRSWISLTFGTTRVVGRQPYAPAAFTPGEIPGTHFRTVHYIVHVQCTLSLSLVRMNVRDSDVLS